MNYEELEKIRSNNKKKRKKSFIILGVLVSVILSVGIFAFFQLKKQGLPDFVVNLAIYQTIGLLVIILIFSPFILSNQSGNKKEYHDAIVEFVLKNYPNYIVGNGRLAEGTNIPLEYINKVFLEGGSCTLEQKNVITGVYNGNPVIMSDVKVRSGIFSQRNGGIEVIKGLWMTFNINKNYNCDLEIIGKYMLYNSLNIDSNYVRVALENSAYNDSVQLYTSNREEAIKILTPEFVKALEDIMKIEGSYEKIILISNNQVHLVFDFDIKINDKEQLNINEIITSIQNKLKPIFDFISIIGD